MKSLLSYTLGFFALPLIGGLVSLAMFTLVSYFRMFQRFNLYEPDGWVGGAIFVAIAIVVITRVAQP